jgi:hypothetical protein
MKVLDEGHTYETQDGQTLNFIKRTNGELVHEGTTNEELLEVLLDRTKFLDDKFPCVENKAAIAYMQAALDSFNSRTAKRVAQGVETKDIAHVS